VNTKLVKYNKGQLPTGGVRNAESHAPHVSFVKARRGQPTIQFSGVNLQILNGQGKTNP